MFMPAHHTSARMTSTVSRAGCDPSCANHDTPADTQSISRRGGLFGGHHEPGHARKYAKMEGMKTRMGYQSY
jgi:hypothetical protein